MSTMVASNSDILMSIKQEHMGNIATGRKNHEYRKYKLPASVQRVWFYTTAPASNFEYVALIGPAREPGYVKEDGGIGNEEFNAGKKVSKFGYEILTLWKICPPLGLREAVEKGFIKGPPQKYSWAKTSLLDAYPLDDQELILARVTE